MTEKNWKVFQRDVLDVLRQYEGYFDFFERIGSLSDDSRPDCFARITRDDKKEIWILDAKNKETVDEEDLNRMKKYIEMVRSNPIDVGLELTELNSHQVRGIFITSSGNSDIKNFEQVKFSQLHQFLQKELIYTDIDKQIRDISKMVERRQLSQNQARLLFRSLKPFEERMKMGVEKLRKIETDFIGLNLEEPPIESYEHKIPVDAVLTHNKRDQVFLFDIPYSKEALTNVDSKVEEIKGRIEDAENPIFYSAIDTFGQSSSNYAIEPKNLEYEIRETAGIISPEKVSSLFEPKIPVEKNYQDNFVQIKDKSGTGYQAKIQTTDDINYKIEVKLPKEAVSKVKEHFLNTRELGQIKEPYLQHKFEINEDLTVEFGDRSETLESYQDAIKSLFRSAINPALGKKVSNKVS